MNLVLVGAVMLGCVLLVFALSRRPVSLLAGFLVRTGVGLVVLWLLQKPGAMLGIQLGVNLWNGAVLGALGVPGFALLLLACWALR